MFTHSLQINVNGRVAMEATGEGWLIANILEEYTGQKLIAKVYGLELNWKFDVKDEIDTDDITYTITRIAQSASELTHADG